MSDEATAEPNEPMFRISEGDRVAVTGAAGFIGAAVTRALIERGARVRAMVEPGRPAPNLDDLEVEIIEADVRDETSVRRGVDGARFVFHLAALYGFWPRDPGVFYDINVEGSRTVLATAFDAGCERACYTSTVATIGLQRTIIGEAAREDDPAQIEHLFGSYKRSKYVAEHEVLRMAAQGMPLVLVQPTFPVGPGDERPTPTGKVVLDFLQGKMPGYVQTTFNVAHVDDLAQGHLAAIERGRQGRSYICGGENLEMSELLATLATVSGLPFPDHKVPVALAMAAAWASDTIEGRLLGREPHVPLEGARMSATQMRFDDSRARDELGYSSRPAAESLVDATADFLDRGLLPTARAEIVRRALALRPT